MAQESNSDPLPPTPQPVTVTTALSSTSSSSKLPPLTTTISSGSGGTSSRSSPSPVNASSPSNESPHDELQIKNQQDPSGTSSEECKVEPKRPLKGKDDLLYLIRTASHVEGLLVEDIQHAYPTVMEDLVSLQKGNLIYIFEGVVYPNDPRFLSRTDQDIKNEYRGIKVPDDLEKELRKNRITPTPKSDEKRAAAQRRAMSKRRK